MRTATVSLITLALLVAACDRQLAHTPAEEDQGSPVAVSALAARAEAPATLGTEDVTSAQGFALPGATDVLPNLLIRSGSASIQVDSLERALGLIRDLAGRVGGLVAGSAMQSGRGELHRATFELRVPAERFDAAVDGLRALGKVESVNVSAQDAGEEYTDVQARMTNARRLEARLIDLLARRTGKLADVLEVEHELARVRGEIERYEGRLRYLRTRAAVSTLTVTVHEPVPVVDHGSPGVVTEALRQAWRNFIVLVALAIQSLGVVIPLGIVAGAGWWAIRRWRRPPPRPAAA